MFCAEPVSVLVTVILPLVVIGPPNTDIPGPGVRSTEVTVPTNWSVDDMVKFGYVPVMPTLAPAVKTTVWSGAELVMVKVSVVAFVVTDIPVPEATVSVSLLLSATIVTCVATATFLKINWSEPLSVLVTVIVPVVVTGPPVVLMPVPPTTST